MAVTTRRLLISHVLSMLLGTLCLLVVFIQVVHSTLEDSPPTVDTRVGTIQGVRKDILDKEVLAFLGIPYAEPPVGKRRFMKPETKTAWEGVLDATSYGYACFQTIDATFQNFSGSQMWNPNVNLSEDCLTLNIWVPAQRSNELLAVMVWIYGGGFYSGCASLDVYNGEVLSTKQNVIVATINYRVGSLGFLAMGDAVNAPGNMGLFDQALALLWIQDYIDLFGGDLNRITIFGESSGAASVNLHMLSPISSGLFQRPIMQSGSSVTPWAVLSQEEATRRGLLLAEKVGCYTPIGEIMNSDQTNTIIQCLRNISAQEIIANEFVEEGTYIFPFVAVVDGEFLTETPTSALIREAFKHTEVMLGTNTNEGSFFMIYYLTEFDKDTESLINRTQFHDIIADAIPAMNDFGRDAIAFQYTDWLSPNDTALLRDATEAYVSDYNIVCPVHEFARSHSNAANNVYTYHFDQRAANNEWGEWMGVMHGDEIAFVFGQPLRPGLGFSEGDTKLSAKMMELWANFARTGNPNTYELINPDIRLVDWPLFNRSSQLVYLLKDTTVDIPKSYTWNRANYCAFWQEYVPKLNTQTANIDEAERQWKEEFYQWSTKYMVDWKAEFNHYMYNKDTGCPGNTYNDTP